MFTISEQIFYIFICICGILAFIKLCCSNTKPADKIIIRRIKTPIISIPPPYEEDNVPLPKYEEEN